MTFKIEKCPEKLYQILNIYSKISSNLYYRIEFFAIALNSKKIQIFIIHFYKPTIQFDYYAHLNLSLPSFNFLLRFHSLLMSSFFSSYRLGAKLGQGSFGTVYECSDINSGTTYAVKVIQNKKVKDFDPSDEILALKTLSHHAIPKVYGVFAEDKDGCSYVVMEKCQGISLKCYLQKSGKLPITTAFSITRQLLKVIEYMHLNGFAHLDLKPDNIILNPITMTIKVIDFGFATNKIEICTTYCGSLPYTSPEILQQKPYNACKADIWSVGIIFYELITGKLPFNYDNFYSAKSTIDEICTRDIKLPSNEIDVNSHSIINFALNHDPIARASASTLLKLLDFHHIPKCIKLSMLKPHSRSSSAFVRPRFNIIKIAQL